MHTPQCRNRSGRTERIELMQAKDNVRRVMAMLRQDAKRMRQDAARQLYDARSRYSSTVEALKQRIRDARNLYLDERRTIIDGVKRAKLSASQQLAHEREQVATARSRVSMHVTSAQRAAGQRLNETFFEAMDFAANAIDHEHHELMPLFRKWRNTGLARRAFSRAMKTVRGRHKGRVPRSNEIGDAVAVEWLEQHIESLSSNMQNINESIERCVERAEKKIRAITTTDPEEYEREAARVWDECKGRS